MQRPLFAIVIMAGIALAEMPGIALAQQTFPSKPIRLVSSTTPGSQPDGIARMIIQKMSENWGKPVIMDNRPGAGGALAAGMVAKAAPDGHTLLYVLPNFVISPAMHPNFPYAQIKEFAGIAQIGFSTNILVASPSLGVKTVKDFIALAKAQPGKIIFGSSATGTAGQLSGTRFNLLAGIKVVTVAFKGGPDAAIEILGGRTHYTVATLGVALPFIKESKMVPLAVTTPQRTPVLPDVPSLGEIQAEFRQSETSHGLLAPAGTPRAILNQISKEVARVLDLPDTKERLQAIGYVIAPSTPEGYDKILREQMDTISTLVRDAGLRAK
ncbi:MAG TPA: tripartite tricarboxylate transporter substrate-binding protein [Burkholderiales bacterium]|nr:tripartite tricarboxylate transporter substrate-binding protein [Burkholderiales bacterium]